jgi:3'-phosphoadenosine 5'-phosphosulfate sulfotransferase (PAPS reductase)/FAD synthetase
MLDAPFEVSNSCCRIMKKVPTKKYERETGRKPFLGMLADESIKRKTAWMKTGCNAFDLDRPQSQPMAFWTEQDILHYIKKFDIPYCPVYGDIVVKPPDGVDADQINIIDYLGCYEEDDVLTTTGRDRTGCIFCMFGCHLEKEPNRFQRLKETHPRQYEYCIKGGEMVDGKWQPNKEGLGLGKVLDYVGVKYE